MRRKEEAKVPESGQKRQYEPPQVIFEADLDDLARDMGPAQACTGFTGFPLSPEGMFDLNGIFSP